MALPLSQYLVNLPALRTKLARAEERGSRMGRVWKYLKRVSRAHPQAHPWLLPLVALVEEDADLTAHAKRAIQQGLATYETVGAAWYLNNIWCFSFPLARWALWFDLLRRNGAYDEAEAHALAGRFLLQQYRDGHSVLLCKPYPECVDNQAAALVLSSYLVGTLLADAPGGGHLARFLRAESAPRLGAMIGGMPPGGYSGEGSTYQTQIVSFAVPLIVEALEHLTGEDHFARPLPPQGTSAFDILRMTKRLWMPGGTVLPWDDYGYQFSIRWPLAYFAHRTGDPACLDLLEHTANWSRVILDNAGWGLDEPLWTLIHWPESDELRRPVRHASWVSWDDGGCLVSPDGNRYAMQMWDPTSALPIRGHVNPNSLIFAVDGIPVSADGSFAPGKQPLKFPGATHTRIFGPGEHQTLDVSKGCGGGHNAILLDGNEALRPRDGYERSYLADFNAERAVLTGDVTGLYRSVYPDALCVRRSTRLIENRFWLVEDYAAFEEAHEFTSRWFFRPGAQPAPDGVDVTTPEGVVLQMRNLLGSAHAAVRRLDGYPKAPDECSDLVDFALGRAASEARWLWLVWPSRDRAVSLELDTGWRARPVPADADGTALAAHADRSYPLQPGLPPLLQADVPATAVWGFDRRIPVPASQRWWLRLPRGIGQATKLWIDGREVPIAFAPSGADLLPTFVPAPLESQGRSEVHVALRIEYFMGGARKDGLTCVADGAPAVCVEDRAAPRIASARYEDGYVLLTTTDGAKFKAAHKLLPRTRERARNPVHAGAIDA